MKIKTQISAVIISIVILSVCVAVTTAVTGIKLRNRDDSEQYRREELQRTKQKLKNQVTTAYTTIEANHRNAGDKEFLQKHYGHRLKNIIDVAETVLRQKTRLVDNGTLTLAEAQRRAIREIKAIRYDDGTGYIWINDTKRPYPMMIMHPTTPSLDGTVLDDQKRHCTSDTGENVFQLFVERGRTQGEGFVLYRWPKPTREGLVTDVQKLSYVRLFQDWGWIIGTGIYVDDALTDALEKSKADIRAMRYDDGIGYFWINDTGRPIPKIIMHPLQPSLEGAVLDNPEYNCAFGTDKNLFQAFVDVCSMQGDGFVEYLWPKPTDNGLTTPQPKLSYVRLYEPLGWIIGTGVYVDSIDAGIRKKTFSMHTQVNYLIINIMVITSVFALVAILLSLFCAGSLTRPIGKLITMMQEIRNEGISKKRVDLNGAREINDLGIIFNSMLDNIDQATRELTETTAAKERIESELNIARDIQMSIIPKLFPAFPERTEFDVQAVLQTAKAVGGDLYDFFFIDKNHLCFAIGDVSGKGVPASLFMAVTRTLLRAHAVDGLTAGQIVTNMNEILYRDNDMCMFVTFYLSILTISTGDIQICNAGHNPPVLIRRGQSLEQLTQRHGVPLGALEDAVYATDTVNLQPGDTLFLYTDGVTEAENSRQELFGEARLDEVLERNKTGNARKIIETVEQAVADFSAEVDQSDDITMLALTYHGLNDASRT